MEEFNHLKIQLHDIISATENFSPSRLIGRGGFGSVYRGELSRPEGLVMVACKRLDRKFGQGNVEFLKEIVMLSNYKHENLVSLLHFCIDGDERILVYEYASRGSLDFYLSDTSLTWTRRLRICIGAAQALDYLHDPAETHQRVLHRDIKSSNILLDEEWNAKVSDFGLSKVGPANQYLVSNAVDTPGYCDPLYWETGILSIESDVYSFGVMLFEVMCGTLCYEYCDGRFLGILVGKWKKCFEEKRLDDIISHGPKNMEPGSLNTFSTIAYQCLKTARKERPTMAEIVEQLKIALEQQDVFDDIGKKMNFEEMRRIADRAVSPLSYVAQSQLQMLFMKGVLLDKGKTWVSIDYKGQYSELISAAKCVSTSNEMYTTPIRPSRMYYLCRFEDIYHYAQSYDLRLEVVTQFLTPNVTYVANLVYHCTYLNYRGPIPEKTAYVPLKYKVEEMGQYSNSCMAHVGERGCLRTELFQFTSIKEEHYFDIQFSSQEMGGKHYSIDIEGIEFCPVDFENDEERLDMQAPTYSYNDWEERLLDDFIKIVKSSKDIERSMTRKEIYLLLRKGIYINNSQQWFSISKKSQKRLLLPAEAIMPEKESRWNFLSLQRSRFKEAVECCNVNRFAISLQIEPHLLSHDIMYACYLVFKLSKNASVFEGIVGTMHAGYSAYNYVYLVTPPHTPIVILCPNDERSSTRKIKGHPKLRKDGWMEIQVWKLMFNCYYVPRMDGHFESMNGQNFTGLLVRGVEFRPAKV